jgi:type IV secretory pathway VirB10-like protein
LWTDAGETVHTTLGIVRVPDASPLHPSPVGILSAVQHRAATATTPAAGQRRRIAVDGKTLRGSRHGDIPPGKLLAAFDQQHHVVLARGPAMPTPGPTAPADARKPPESTRHDQQHTDRTRSKERPPQMWTSRRTKCEDHRVDPVYQHPNRSILVAGPEITVRPVATRVLTRDDAQ